MMMTTLTPKGMQALAWYAAVMRREAGITPDWDQAGVYAAITRITDRGTAVELTDVVLRAALNPKAETPGIIPLAGAHWTPATAVRPSTTPSSGRLRDDERCPLHPHDQHGATNCGDCRAEYLADGVWPTGSLHRDAQRTYPTTDHATRAAGDTQED